MTYDFIVIGAGIAGCSVAYELSRSARVCVVETESQPGYHATSRSAAVFAPSYGGREFRAITRASRMFFGSPPPGFAEHPLVRKRGCLYIARADQCGQLAHMVKAIRASGGHIAPISRQEAFTLVPLLRKEYVAEAAMDSDAMDIDVDALQQGFLRGARATGAVLVTNNRVDSIQRRNGLWSIALSGGLVSAPIVINAAGAWADQVAELCGALPIGLRALRRTALLVDAPRTVDVRSWPAVIDADELFYFKPEVNGLLLSPADEIPQSPADAQPEELEIAVGVDRVQAALNIDVQRIRRSWAGLRTFAPDRVPVIGMDPQVEGLFWCAGQGGYGIQTAPAMARIAAALIKQEHLPADVAAEGLHAADLSPSRFVATPARLRPAVM